VREVDDAHAARAELGDDLIAPDLRAGREARVLSARRTRLLLRARVLVGYRVGGVVAAGALIVVGRNDPW
jgi:hypothetical protein